MTYSDHLVQLPDHSRADQKLKPKCLFNTDRLGAYTTSPGSLLQCLTTLSVMKSFLLSSLNLPILAYPLLTFLNSKQNPPDFTETLLCIIWIEKRTLILIKCQSSYCSLQYSYYAKFQQKTLDLFVTNQWKNFYVPFVVFFFLNAVK